MNKPLISSAFKNKVHSVLTLLDEIGVPIAKEDRYSQSVKKLAHGSVFKIGEVHYLVSGSRSKYNQKGYEWFEYKVIALTGPELGEIHYFEWEEDDELELSLSYQKLTIAAVELDNESPEKARRAKVDGNSYQRDEKYTAKYYRDESGAGEKVMMVEFVGKKNKNLTIEIWESGETEVWLSQPIAPASIQILTQAQKT